MKWIRFLSCKRGFKKSTFYKISVERIRNKIFYFVFFQIIKSIHAKAKKRNTAPGKIVTAQIIESKILIYREIKDLPDSYQQSLSIDI